MDKYTLNITLQVLEHLGEGLYSNTPSVVSELVANAYDADAEVVKVSLGAEIIVEDNGVGMTIDDANQKFLTVGYRKRDEQTSTPIHNRKPMGRKGIGKLSVFAIADEVEVHSVTCDENGAEVSRIAFCMNAKDIRSAAATNPPTPYHPKEIEFAKDLKKGTRLVLRELKARRKTSIDNLRRSLSRRFSIFGAEFCVEIDGDELTVADRAYWDKLQFVWSFGSSGYNGLAWQNTQEHITLSGKTSKGREIKGWIGTVKQPKDLKDSQVDANGIVVLSRGKVVHENLLPFVRDVRIFTEYIVGELEASWLDDDDQDDMSTSDRQGLQEDDPRFDELRDFLREQLSKVASEWLKFRQKVGVKEAVKRHPALSDWLNQLPKDNRKIAEKLIATVEALPLSDDEARKGVLKNTIVAFETLALRQNINALSHLVDGVNSSAIQIEQFIEVFDGMRDLEAAHYYDIVKGRFEILTIFEKRVDDNEKERRVQEHLFGNLWLLSPTWERATVGDSRMEERFLTKLESEKLGVSRKDELSRFDIKYVTNLGRHVVIELKRGGRSVNGDELITQMSTYKRLMKAALTERGEPNAQVEIIAIVGKMPSDFEEGEKMLHSIGARIYTYEEVISNTRQSYEDYLAKGREIERVQKLIEQI